MNKMDIDAFEKEIYHLLPKSFSENHVCLLRIAFGDSDVESYRPKILNEAIIDQNDVEAMIQMVKMEFWSSLQKEMTGTDDSRVKARPNPYDIFLMEASFDRTARCNIAICMPLKNSRTFAW